MKGCSAQMLTETATMSGRKSLSANARHQNNFNRPSRLPFGGDHLGLGTFGPAVVPARGGEWCCG